MMRTIDEESANVAWPLERTVINCTSSQIFAIDQKGVCRFITPALARELGHEPQEIVGRMWERIDPDPVATNMIYQARDRVFSTGKDICSEGWFSTLHKYIRYEASPLRIYGDRIAAAVITLVDITRSKEVARQAEIYAEELKRSNDELQEFAYVASHDLKEPLRMVYSYLVLLERKAELDERSEEYLHYALDGAIRMQAMIDDLLAYSRVQSKGKEFIPVDMEDVLNTALKDLRVDSEESEATVTHDILPTIMADRTQMVLLLVNLIGNAIKYRGASAPRIHISAQANNGEWLFSVQDNGIGIPPEQHGRLFQMFHRLHTRDEYQGTGMGLAISRRIVERHGGRMWLRSRVGEGSTFFFTIPKVTSC